MATNVILAIIVGVRFMRINSRSTLVLEPLFSCDCNEHWGGENCTEFDHCNPNPCLNSGICIEQGNHFECLCENDYSGILCDISPCDSVRVLKLICS